MKKIIKTVVRKIFLKIFPELSPFLLKKTDINQLQSTLYNTTLGVFTKIYPVHKINNCKIGDYTYIAKDSQINNANIGKFCSIGPGFKCGWGIHPTNGLSTSPMFYSTLKQNGMTLSKIDKIKETKNIEIGNDVFIGRDVIVLDGVTIGDGAIIGAGAVVSKDIPAFAVAVGCPIKVIKYRFTTEQIDDLLKIEWWNFSEEILNDVEKFFFDINDFIDKYKKK